MQRRSEAGECVCAGSITLFLALTVTLVLSLFFSLLEAARVQGLSMIAQRSLKLSLTSALGAYHVPLWQDYHLLFVDGGDGEGQFSLPLLEGNMAREDAQTQRGTSFYQIAFRDIEISKYELASDRGGTPFRIQACKAAKERLALDAAGSVKEKLEAAEELKEKRKELDDSWNLAQDAKTEAENWNKGQEEEGETGAKLDSPEGSAATPVDKLPQNPMDFVKVWKSSPMLALVVENPSEISGKGTSLDDRMAKRKRQEGNLVKEEKESLEKLWLVQYLNYYFSCQNGAGAGGSKTHALDYELEYCIGGKGTDRENLEKTVKELLLVREAGNFATIMQDGKKKALALEMATAAAGFTGIVPLVQAIQVGILLGWSYMESILDVRCLLEGGKVPLVKEVSEWKSDVFSGSKVLEEKAGGGAEEKGLCYREYLQILLLATREEELSYRAMDIIERNIRMQPGEGQFRMDYAIQGMEAEALYQADFLFLGFVAGVKIKGRAYHFNCKEQLFY